MKDILEFDADSYAKGIARIFMDETITDEKDRDAAYQQLADDLIGITAERQAQEDRERWRVLRLLV